MSASKVQARVPMLSWAVAGAGAGAPSIYFINDGSKIKTWSLLPRAHIWYFSKKEIKNPKWICILFIENEKELLFFWGFFCFHF